MLAGMTVRPPRLVALIAVLLIALLDPTADAQTKKKKKTTPKKKAAVTRKATPKKKAAAPVAAVPVGRTFEERLASLVNGSVASNSDSGIQVVELESGRVVAQRNPHVPLSPASNMKLFTTGAAIDLLKPGFEV